MSLDITLTTDIPIVKRAGTGIFIRDNGGNRELSRAEVLERWPHHQLDDNPGEIVTNEAFSINITHNLNTMAKEANLYEVMWRPEELDVAIARDAIVYLASGLTALLSRPADFAQYNPSNGWGSYDNLVDTVRAYLKACIDYPDARIEISR